MSLVNPPLPLDIHSQFADDCIEALVHIQKTSGVCSRCQTCCGETIAWLEFSHDVYFKCDPSENHLLASQHITTQFFSNTFIPRRNIIEILAASKINGNTTSYKVTVKLHSEVCEKT